MFRKAFLVVFTVAVIAFFLLIGFYFLQKGNNLARFADSPSKIAELYAVKPPHFEGSTKNLKWYRGNVVFHTETAQPILLKDYQINLADRDILMAGGSIKRQYLIEDPYIVKLPDADDNGFWEYVMAALFFVLAIFCFYSLFKVSEIKRL